MPVESDVPGTLYILGFGNVPLPIVQDALNDKLTEPGARF